MNITPPPGTIFPTEMGERLEMLFERAFGVDYRNRPTAMEWAVELEEHTGDIITCDRNRRHTYSRGGVCHWCRIEQEFTSRGVSYTVFGYDVRSSLPSDVTDVMSGIGEFIKIIKARTSVPWRPVAVGLKVNTSGNALASGMHLRKECEAIQREIQDWVKSDAESREEAGRAMSAYYDLPRIDYGVLVSGLVVSLLFLVPMLWVITLAGTVVSVVVAIRSQKGRKKRHWGAVQTRLTKSIVLVNGLKQKLDDFYRRIEDEDKANKVRLQGLKDNLDEELERVDTMLKKNIAEIVELTTRLESLYQEELESRRSEANGGAVRRGDPEVERDIVNETRAELMKGYFIARYRIPRIGAHFTSLLRQYNVETAYDINRAALRGIPGIGPAREQSLLEFRAQCDAKIGRSPKPSPQLLHQILARLRTKGDMERKKKQDERVQTIIILFNRCKRLNDEYSALRLSEERRIQAAANLRQDAETEVRQTAESLRYAREFLMDIRRSLP